MLISAGRAPDTDIASEAIESGQARILAATNIAAILALVALLPIAYIEGFKPTVLGILLWLVLCCVTSSFANLRGRYVLGTYLFLAGFSLGLFVAMILPTELTTSPSDGHYLVAAYFFSLPILAAGGLLFPSAAFAFAAGGSLFGLIAAMVRTQGAFFSQPEQVAALSTPVLLMFLVAAMSWLYGDNLISSLLRIRQRKAEVERMSQELRQSNENLADAVRSVRQLAARMAETAEHLSGASVEITDTSQQQAGGSTQQAAAVAEISATVEQLSRAAAQIAESAEETLRSAEEGRSTVGDTMRGMEAIKSRVEATTQRILLLGEHSQRIGEITDIISEIAGKTHLLALNAAIESAAAGEYGRRFAVVAQQVKELANETKQATIQVKGVIAQAQSATNASVIATEHATKEVERGLELTQRARGAMDEIVERAQTITLATHEQQDASEQTVLTMRDIADVARQSASSAQRLAESAVQLSGLARNLREAVAKLSEE